MPGFDDAHRRALMEDLLRLLLGLPVDLLPLDEVREGLHLASLVDRGSREVPLASIVGSLGRSHEFNRAFLPREASLRERWQRLRARAEGAAGFDPVELYQVGAAYFVADGHHRVSVARAMGLETIEARVKEYLTPVHIAADESIEEILLKGGLADFLAATGLQPVEPDEYRMTVANGYERLLQHINVHRYFLGLDSGRAEVPWEEAVRSWHGTVFRPMIVTIRRSGALEQFPGRSEADLYLFTMDHLHFLREEYGVGEVAPAQAVHHFAAMHRPRPRVAERLRRWWRRLAGAVSPARRRGR